MNHIERFRAVMEFKPVDRLPRWEWATWWDQTIKRWWGEGLPNELTDTFDIEVYFGLDPIKQFWISPRGKGLPNPEVHGAGIVASTEEYERVLPHLFPNHDELYLSMQPWGERQARGEAVIWATYDGFFWFPRTLFGIEPHMYAFYDHPELMHRMCQGQTDFILRSLEQMAPYCVPTFITMAEDMSYNHGPMLSKELFDEFIAPYYRQIVPVLEQMNIIPIIDSDGDITRMVPWFAEVGVHGFLPLERQAGVDGMQLRQMDPRLLIIGHFDKMTMPLGREAMRAEFERLLPLMRTGGYIPGVDHQTPPGVSLEQYRIYLELLNEYTVLGAQA
ncbi:MAG: hypothetical protein GXY52_05305 [Chloroflexi bacterium]|nr:hypothetical protein [Chloroflexota bacterium]